ncbi:D-glycero-beta-D-manno-heptose-7-phosphate kinase [uncultured Mitsuokella sp.]|jgi:D-glycero-beta-D-manno-heptose-7-phosphate kinase|uniref:D-glycero-beta-D-manno-heptose-7-phosphate kinase n=1 Tax=uncultured Mitsuokella sp. TaxID=453120 RepID=UPI0025F79708|nr:D-glycero-beta-D-manno-heptose-7-phosphate kinase [uncultured Mitsuokella sp.]
MDREQLYDFVAQRTSRCKILVVGDVMLDKYYYGEVTRISPEAPVPITHVLSEKETLGGAANVAHNLALLGCETSITGFVGDDYHCQSLLDKFTARGIDYHGLITTDRPTTTKLRVIGGHQQMMRLDFEESAPITGPYAERFLNYIHQKLNESLDCVIISDYGKGSCTEENCRKIIEACHAHGVPVVVDPKGANWTKYAHADYITPNLKEINQVLLEPIRNEDKAVEKAAHYVMRKFKIRNIIVTRSEEGLSLVRENEIVHIPTKAQEVFDVSGAGDTVIAVFAMGLAGGMSPADSAYMANLAASVVVAKLGTYAVSREELMAVLRGEKRD